MFLIVGGDSEIGAAACRAMKAQGVAVAATTRRHDQVAGRAAPGAKVTLLDNGQPIGPRVINGQFPDTDFHKLRGFAP